MTNVGFIGIGLMGLPMCKRLLSASVPLSVWNRTPEKCQRTAVHDDKLLT